MLYKFTRKLAAYLSSDQPSASQRQPQKAIATNCRLPESLPTKWVRYADILVACDRFETGYDNSAICIMGVDRRIGSAEKLVQVYSRANRQRPGKNCPLVVDFQNAPQDVERAIVDFSVTRECLVSVDQVETLSNALREALGDLLQLEETTLVLLMCYGRVVARAI